MIRQVLALLAAAEEAHTWVFGARRKIDPTTGGALTPLPEQFQGLEIGLLAYLLDRDRAQAAAYDRIDPGLLLTLQTLRGVIWISRASEGATRFRLALKEFLPAAKADPIVGPMLPLMYARIAARAFDAAELLGAEGGDASGSLGVVSSFRPLAGSSSSSVRFRADCTAMATRASLGARNYVRVIANPAVPHIHAVDKRVSKGPRCSERHVHTWIKILSTQRSTRRSLQCPRTGCD